MKQKENWLSKQMKKLSFNKKQNDIEETIEEQLPVREWLQKVNYNEFIVTSNDLANQDNFEKMMKRFQWISAGIEIKDAAVVDRSNLEVAAILSKVSNPYVLDNCSITLSYFKDGDVEFLTFNVFNVNSYDKKSRAYTIDVPIDISYEDPKRYLWLSSAGESETTEVEELIDFLNKFSGE